MTENADLAPMLERRRIEAEILSHVYETVKAVSGVDEARRVVAESVRRSAIAQGQAMAEAQGGAPGLKGFEDIQPLWTRGGTLEVEVREKGDKIFAFTGPGSVGVKCGRTRDEADEWLRRYPHDASAMAYIGRYGWNTLRLDGAIPDAELLEAVETSYADVVARLPRSRRP